MDTLDYLSFSAIDFRIVESVQTFIQRSWIGTGIGIGGTQKSGSVPDPGEMQLGRARFIWI